MVWPSLNVRNRMKRHMANASGRKISSMIVVPMTRRRGYKDGQVSPLPLSRKLGCSLSTRNGFGNTKCFLANFGEF